MTLPQAQGRVMFSAMGHAPAEQRPEAVPVEQVIGSLLAGLSSVIKGKDKFLESLVTVLLAGGHVLIEDSPGLGKTTVARTLAALIGDCTFKRIQFTPDLLPYDITGIDVFDPERREFVFSPGPVFANVVLADEINRTTPKVQSALLEVMAENQVTVGTTTHLIDRLFFVVGTQNPIEIEGTYPLPLAQVDRFTARLRLGYPDEADELAIVQGDPSHRVMPFLEPVCTIDDILAGQQVVQQIYCDNELLTAAVRACRSTRTHPAVLHGVSPRGALMMAQTARARALVRGRDYCTDGDFLEMAGAVLAHRIQLRDHRAESEQIVRDLMASSLRELRL